MESLHSKKNRCILLFKDASVICFENRFGINSQFLKDIIASSVIQNQIFTNSAGSTVETITIEKSEKIFASTAAVGGAKADCGETGRNIFHFGIIAKIMNKLS